MKILIIDDDRELADYVSMRLEENNHTVDVENDGIFGEMKASEGDYDVIVLDIMLPGTDGYSMCRNLRKKAVRTPILMVSSLDTDKEATMGYNVGASAYLTKPFQFDALHDTLLSLHEKFRQKKLSKQNAS